MKIAHICKKFSRLSETFVYNVITGLDAAGTHNRVLTGARLNPSERPFDNVRVIPDPAHSRALFAFSKKVLGRYRYKLPQRPYRRALAEFEPDVVMAHFGGTGLAVHEITRSMDIPLVVSFYGFDMFARYFRSDAYHELWNSASAVVAVSRYAARRLEEYFDCPPDKIHLIHFGIDTDSFRPVSARRQSSTVKIATVGRLVEKKGTANLIHAVREARRGFGSAIELDIYGEGPLDGRLRKIVKNLDAGGYVNFHGKLASRRVPEVLAAHDIFALPSMTARNGDREGVPLSILEAQAMALPVLTTRHSGIPEAIPERNHIYLARENDVQDLTGKLALLVSHAGQWPIIGQQGREKVVSEFSIRSEVRAYRDLFDSVAGRRNPAREAENAR